MKDQKFTKRPWEVVEHSWSDTSIIAGDETICTLSIYEEATEDNQEEMEDHVSANFRLIAAAPELLKALINLSEWYHNHIKKEGIYAPLYVEADRAISKALGE